MKRTAAIIIPLLAAVAALSGCNGFAKYNTKNVTIKVDIADISSGYICADFEPSKDAYYIAGAMEITDEYDPVNKPDHFMTLMADSLYRQYLDWRYEYLKDQVSYVADFSSHSLMYGATTRYFVDVEPDTDYWVYSFVVDPNSNQPCGDLYLTTVHTTAVHDGRLFFEATTDDETGFYVYPYSLDTGELSDDIPYTYDIAYSYEIFTYQGQTLEDGIRKYCDNLYATIVRYNLLSSWMAFGVDYEDQSEWLLDGVESYLIIGEFDGGIVNRTVYRFTWHEGEKIELIPCNLSDAS